MAACVQESEQPPVVTQAQRFSRRLRIVTPLRRVSAGAHRTIRAFGARTKHAPELLGHLVALTSLREIGADLAQIAGCAAGLMAVVASPGIPAHALAESVPRRKLAQLREQA